MNKLNSKTNYNHYIDVLLYLINEENKHLLKSLIYVYISKFHLKLTCKFYHIYLELKLSSYFIYHCKRINIFK